MKVRKIETILKHTDIQVVDKIEDMLNDLTINNSYISLLEDYLLKGNDTNISDKEALTLYYYDKEHNKQGYINLLDEIRSKNDKIHEDLTRIMLYLKEDIPLEALNDYKED